MKTYTYNTVQELRAGFWRAHPHAVRRKIMNYEGDGKMFVTDTRVAWNNWLSEVSGEGLCSRELANRATLA